MKHSCLLLALALTACSGRSEQYFVAPDNKHVLVGSGTSLVSIDADTLAEVGRATDLAGPPVFSPDGALFAAWNSRWNIIVLPVAGGPPVDLGPSADLGTISANGARLAFLRNAAVCEPGGIFCAELFSAPSAGGEAIRVASGVQVLMGYDFGHPGTAYARYPYQFVGNDTLIFVDIQQNLMSVPADGSAGPTLLAPPVVRSPGDAPFPPLYSVLRDGRVLVQDGAGVLLTDARGAAPVRIADAGSGVVCNSYFAGRGSARSCPVSSAGALAVLTPSTGSAASVRLVSLSGGPSFAVSVTGDWMAFDGDGRFVFFDADGFLAQALPSGDVSQIARSAFVRGLPGVLSPDGKWASFSTAQPNACIGNCHLVQLLSTVTAGTWIAQARGLVLLASDWAFSPDSSLLLVRTADRKLYVAPAEVDGEARLIETDVDQADWAGASHIVINRTQSSPQGVSFLRVR
jgi:hypothetical protein